MALILINGISTSGKSSMAVELKKRGLISYDLEHLASSGWYNKQTNQKVAGFGQMPERSSAWLSQHEWRVSEEEIKQLAEQDKNQTVFICGGAANEDNIAALCDKIIWLKTDEATIRQRVTIPRDHDYGTKPHELDQIIKNNVVKEKQQREKGSIIIDARKPLNDVVESVLEVAKYPPQRS